MFVWWTCNWRWFLTIILFNTPCRTSRSSCCRCICWWPICSRSILLTVFNEWNQFWNFYILKTSLSSSCKRNRWTCSSNHIRTSLSWSNAEISVCWTWYHSFGTFTTWFASHSTNQITTSVITYTIRVITGIPTFIPNLIVRTAAILWRPYIVNVLTSDITLINSLNSVLFGAACIVITSENVKVTFRGKTHNNICGTKHRGARGTILNDSNASLIRTCPHHLSVLITGCIRCTVSCKMIVIIDLIVKCLSSSNTKHRFII